jgi:hypothetical protein
MPFLPSITSDKLKNDMKQLTTILFISLLFTSTAYAETFKMKCTRNALYGNESVTYTVNINDSYLHRADNLMYRFTALTENYISAFLAGPEGVGGDMLVINRKTGTYSRSFIVYVGDSHYAGAEKGTCKRI